MVIKKSGKERVHKEGSSQCIERVKEVKIRTLKPLLNLPNE